MHLDGWGDIPDRTRGEGVGEMPTLVEEMMTIRKGVVSTWFSCLLSSVVPMARPLNVTGFRVGEQRRI